MSGACANRSPKLGEVTPHWKSGDKVSLCPKCRKTFGVFLKREHCRACGEVSSVFSIFITLAHSISSLGYSKVVGARRYMLTSYSS